MRKGDRARQHIIEASAPVFNTLGFTGTSFSDLITATGFEKGGIYRHFESKEALAVEVFDYMVEKVSHAKFDSLADLPSGILKLETMIRNFNLKPSPITGGCPVYNCAIENDDGNPLLRKKARAALQKWITEITAYVDQAKVEGDIKVSVDSERLATFLLVTLEGALLAKKLLKKPSLGSEVSDDLLEYLQSKRA